MGKNYFSEWQGKRQVGVERWRVLRREGNLASMFFAGYLKPDNYLLSSTVLSLTVPSPMFPLLEATVLTSHLVLLTAFVYRTSLIPCHCGH